MAKRPSNSGDNGQDIRNQALENMGLGDDTAFDTDTDVGDEDEALEDAGAQLPAMEDDGTDALEGLIDLDLAERKEERPSREAPHTEQEQQPSEPSIGPIRYDKDAKGNIIDKKTGKVLATAGESARHFMDLQHARVQLRRADQNVTTLKDGVMKAVDIARRYKAQADAAEASNRLGQENGIDSVELAEAARFAGEIKKGGDAALTAIRSILTRAATAGVNIASLGTANALNPADIVAALRQEMEPILSDVRSRQEQENRTREQQEADRQNHETVARSVLQFFEDNPEAVAYADRIERVMKDPRAQGYTLREVWFQIQNYLLRNPEQRGNQTGNGHAMPDVPAGRQRPAQQDSGQFDRPVGTDVSYKQLIDKLLSDYKVT